MAGEGPILNRLRTLGNGDTIVDMKRGTTPFAPTPAALAFAARQVVTPGIVPMARDLIVDKAIDSFGADQLAPLLPLDPAPGLLRRPAFAQAGQKSCCTSIPKFSKVGFLAILLPATICGTLLISTLTRRWIEEPRIALGKRLSNRSLEAAQHVEQPL